MFLCDNCHGPEPCLGSIVGSSGQCEKCRKMAACLDCPTPAHRQNSLIGRGDGTRACCNDLFEHPQGQCPNYKGRN